VTGRVVVAMSGGVDSSVAAALLLDQGFEVLGVTLQLRPCGEGVQAGSCCGQDAIGTARAVADRLGIEHQVLPVGAEFLERVLRPAWDACEQGRTPNPCVACNREIKFGVLWQFAAMLGAEAVATGHYARIDRDLDGTLALRRGRDPTKDQSYFLYDLPEAARGRVRFPLGDLRKDEVRRIARERGLESADRADSQDACLVADGDFAEGLRRVVGGAVREGEVVAEDGRVLGRHRGIHRVTVGQRRGLGIAAGRPIYVRDIDPGTGLVTVTADRDALLSAGMVVRDVRWWISPPEGPIEAAVQVRYRSREFPAEVCPLPSGDLEVRFRSPVRAITPGQAAVLYQGDRVIAGGEIRLVPDPPR